MSADLGRALGFLHDFARRRAPVEVAVPGGFAVLDERYPGSHDDNKLIVPSWDGTDSEAASILLKAADEVLAAREHRLVCVDDDRIGTALAPAFAAAGYTHETNLIMAHRGAPPPSPSSPPSSPPSPSPSSPPSASSLPSSPPSRAERLELAELLPVLRRDWRHTLPEASDEVVDGLARRVEARLLGADTVSFHGVRAPDGQIAARADLYAHGGVAQIEGVFTAAAYRGQGHARTLMTALLAEVAGAELVFLVADADDWPKDFYGRLGFHLLGRTHSFLRT
ncbi:GNAT family N-acetyltransferase [Nonomuraea purpurea]|uniref:GNAT family N-acetyltransferase n=1 Tax=Nonomuraea purpurea TaxID=1849276 RepID=A0ABV8FZ99_9ACTN